MAQSFQSLIRFGFHTKIKSQDKNLGVMQEKLIAIARDFAAEIAKVAESGELTPQGMRKARAEIGDTFLEKLTNLLLLQGLELVTIDNVYSGKR